MKKPAIVLCFAKNTEPALHLPQARLMIRLLNEWDYYPEIKDSRMLAYVLGTALHETSNLRVFSENLSYKTPQRILAVFPRQFSEPDPKAALEDAAQYVNSPEKLANRVYNRASLGNINEGDGWRYRGRGILLLTGRADYREHQALIGGDPLEDDPDLMFNDDVQTRVLFSHFFKKRVLDRFFPPGQDPKWIEARATVAGGKSEAADVGEKSKKILACLPQ